MSTEKNYIPNDYIFDIETRECNRCNILQYLDNYYVRKDGYIYPYCITCTREKARNLHNSEEGQIKRRLRYDQVKGTSEYKSMQKKSSQKHYNSLVGRAKTLLKTTKRKGENFKGQESDIDLDFILEKLEKGICEVTGTPFNFTNTFETMKNPLAPSIDRINGNIGYLKSNTRLVIWQYNLMKGELTDEQVFDIFGEYFENKLKGMCDE